MRNILYETYASTTVVFLQSYMFTMLKKANKFGKFVKFIPADLNKSNIITQFNYEYNTQDDAVNLVQKSNNIEENDLPTTTQVLYANIENATRAETYSQSIDDKHITAHHNPNRNLTNTSNSNVTVEINAEVNAKPVKLYESNEIRILNIIKRENERQTILNKDLFPESLKMNAVIILVQVSHQRASHPECVYNIKINDSIGLRFMIASNI